MRHAGTFWPANAGGEHPSVDTILGLPGSGSLIVAVCLVGAATIADAAWRALKGR